MSSTDYVELHAHSAYSFLDGASLPHELVGQALELGYTHFALTDHDNLSGALEFAHAAKAHGVTPITGAEVTVIDDLQRTAHVTLLARTHLGYMNLCRLLTVAHAPRVRSRKLTPEQVVESWLDVPAGQVRHQPIRIKGTPERPDPSVTLEQLSQHAEGLTCLTGCATRGLLLADIENQRPGRAVELVHQLQRGFGREYVYIELQLPQHRGDSLRNRALRQVAEQAGAPVVATGNVHAHSPQRARLHEVLVAIRHNTTLEGCESQRAGNLALALRSPEQMAHRFAGLDDAVANTRRVSESVEFDLTCDLGYRYPAFDDGEHTPDELLGQVCMREFERRYAGRGSESEARARLERELALVSKHGLSGFFLLHHDVLELAREVAVQVRGSDSARALNPPGRGRGSSVESIICYLTGLSHVDPIEAHLNLGRFLNEDLNSIPDIDLDFPRDIRQELLRRVIERYGSDRCAMVAAHGTYRTKSAVRDVGKALGLPSAELTRIAKRCDGGARHIHEFVEGQGPRWQAFAEMTREIADLPRQIGQHSGGVIISTDPLSDVVPIQPAAMHGRQICQWDKDSCADAGFLKIDVLGLGMLSAVEDCVETIAASRGERIDLSRIDYADKGVYEEIQAGDTVGVFQIESRAQIQSLLRVKPENLHDLTIQVALIRPGPIIGKSVNPYVALREARRTDNDAPVEYDHPLLEPVLNETFGAIIFQDQVIEVAMAVAGFSAGEADGLRRAMTRKRSVQSLERYHERFIEGALAHGVPEETAQVIFGKLMGFAHYGFPRAHSVAFALLAYQSAWLRCHYMPEFYTSLLNAQPMGFYPPDSLLRDAKRHGVGSLPIDVNRSSALCTVEHDDAGISIRVGLGYVKGISYDEALALQRERESGGPFLDIADFARRVQLRNDQIQQLITAGATECFEAARRDQLWQLGLVARPRRYASAGNAQQDSFELPAAAAPKLRQLSLWDELTADFATSGLSVRAHPVELMRGVLPKSVLSIADTLAAPHGTELETVGVIVVRQRPSTSKGTIFLLLEDEHGTVNVIVPPPVYKEHRLAIRSESIVRVCGRLERHDDVINLIARQVWPLPRDLRKKMSPRSRDLYLNVREWR